MEAARQLGTGARLAAFCQVGSQIVTIDRSSRLDTEHRQAVTCWLSAGTRLALYMGMDAKGETTMRTATQKQLTYIRDLWAKFPGERPAELVAVESAIGRPVGGSGDKVLGTLASRVTMEQASAAIEALGAAPRIQASATADRGRWTGCLCGSREDSDGLIPAPGNCASCRRDG